MGGGRVDGACYGLEPEDFETKFLGEALEEEVIARSRRRDEAISRKDKDCFAALAMTSCPDNNQ
jgi:hypothetical protein